MKTNKTIMAFGFACALFHTVEVKNASLSTREVLQKAGHVVSSGAKAVGRDFVKSPVAYLTLAGAGAVCASAPSNGESSPVAGIAFLASVYHGFIFKNWWRLSCDLQELRQERLDGDLQQKNRWIINSHCFDEGYQMAQYFFCLSEKEQKRFQRSLRKQVRLHDIQEALSALQNRINDYGYYSNILLRFARQAGCASNPEELLTGSYLLRNNINEKLLPVLKEHTQGSWISKSYTVRWTWSPLLRCSVPRGYTWSHKVASECVWELLHQYARLKVIKSLLEYTFDKESQVQNINVTLS